MMMILLAACSGESKEVQEAKEKMFEENTEKSSPQN